jgi:hypothetical protein
LDIPSYIEYGHGSFLGKGTDFSGRYDIKTGYGIHSDSYPTCVVNSLPGDKTADCEPDHLPPTSVEVHKALIFSFATSLGIHGLVVRYRSNITFIIWKHRDNIH